MDNLCPTCGYPMSAKRTRCYRCSPGKQRSGEERTCKECGKTFYAARWQLDDTERRQGTYCSRACLTAAKSKMPNWRRDESRLTAHSGGYRLVWVGHEHPSAHNGRILEHRAVVERLLGRYLTPEEHVHHINGDKTDNRPENLVVMSNEEHQRLHDRPLVKSRRVSLVCQECGAEYEKKAGRASESKYCSMSCRSRAVSRARWGKTRSN